MNIATFLSILILLSASTAAPSASAECLTGATMVDQLGATDGHKASIGVTNQATACLSQAIRESLDDGINRHISSSGCTNTNAPPFATWAGELLWQIYDRHDKNPIATDPVVGTYTYTVVATPSYQNPMSCAWDWLCEGAVEDLSTIVSTMDDPLAVAGYKMVVPSYGEGTCDPTATSGSATPMQTFDGCIIPYTPTVGPGLVCLVAVVA